MSTTWSEEYKRKLIPPAQLAEKIAGLRQQNQTIVTLNGSFDLMHAGHLHMIFEASKKGDILILALNSDKSIQQYKNPQRPIIPLEYRLQMMTALFFVSYVTWFDETDPRHILSIIKPDVHVNGAEYGENCIEADIVQSNGGRMHIVQLIPGLSTTKILQKIRNEV
jgi:rfaE bifunctional protein nucleotidyltransferase chain/domain